MRAANLSDFNFNLPREQQRACGYLELSPCLRRHVMLPRWVE